MACAQGSEWSAFKLSSCCLRALNRLSFVRPTPVQHSTIPHFMGHRDVAVEAVTGSGKTVAFVIPIVELLLQRDQQWKQHETGALVVAPTRELASQVCAVLREFLPPHLSLGLFIGGRDVQRDIDIVNRGAHVVVGTPGRLVDLLTRPACSLPAALRSLEVLVMDEADRLLEMGFEPSLSTILSYLPKQRRTGLFSATLNAEVQSLVRAGLRNPVLITVREKATAQPTPLSLHNYYTVCPAEEKLTTLLSLLEQFKDKKVLVFFATCASVSYFSSLASRIVGPVLALHGRMHKKRHKLFAEFVARTSGVLMCTDVMARGIDFPSIDWVVQFDPPSTARSFVHRCGRTARMGQEGSALVLLLPNETSYVDFLNINQQISLQPFPCPHTDHCSLREQARDIAKADREVYEKGMRAYVSFVRFYHKHDSKVIFQPKELDLIALASGFALLHLPKMPELRGVDTSTFPNPIPHPHCKARGKQHKEKSQVPVREERRRRRRRREEKSTGKQPKRKRRRQLDLLSDGDLEELARDARLLKKFKAGKISKEEMEEQLLRM